jgi:2-heptyl-3-hydroxy-4(1H)-quinolone synthase
VSWRFLVDQVGGIDTWTAMLDQHRAFLVMPVARNRLYCYADLTTNAPEDPTQRDVARLRALFRDFAEPVPHILSQLESFDPIHFSPIEEVVVHTWSRGHVVLIGDAAHATSPNMAEGASMALEDALVLSRMLGSHHSIADALSAFNERRRARTQWVQQRTHRRDRIRTLPSPLRDLALRLAGSVFYRRDYLPLLSEP